MKQKHLKWLVLALCLLSGLAIQAQQTASLQVRQADDLQAYLNQLASEQQPAKTGMRKSPTVDIPIGLPEVDLSKFMSNQNRTNTLVISTSVKFINGSITAAAGFSGGGCLLEVRGGVSVVLDTTAKVDASVATAHTACLAAVGIYASSTFVQCGGVTAPGKGNGIAIYVDDAGSTYQYVSGTIKGEVKKDGATASGTCGENVTWKFYAADGRLVISGTGAMNNYPALQTPWCDYAEQIATISIAKGITAIGDFAFYCCNFTEVYCYNMEPPVVGFSAFKGYKNGVMLYVPVRSVGMYEISSAWNSWFSQILPIGVESDCDWTIGELGDFADLNEAMEDDHVEDGHTIEVLSGTTMTGMQTISKAVSVKGSGYKAVNGSRPIHFDGNLSVEADGVKLSGLSMKDYSCLYVRDDNLEIDHCYLWLVQNDEDYYGDNLIVRASMIASGIWSYAGFEGWELYNNIIGTGLYSSAPVVMLRAINTVVDHNIIYKYWPENNEHTVELAEEAVFTNNIVYSADGSSCLTYCADDVTVTNNIISDQYQSERFPDNKFGCNNLSELFRCIGTPQDETYWVLTEVSPAKDFATDGTDCGPWVGDDPYLIGGVEPFVEPLVPMEGDYTLNAQGIDNPQARTYKSLLSLFMAMNKNDIAGDMNIDVIQDNYYLTISDETLPVLQSLLGVLSATTAVINFSCNTTEDKPAIFNFQMDNTFLYQHQQELQAITQQLYKLLLRLKFTNVKIYINGNPEIFDDFQVEANDLLALKNMFQNWGGEGWTQQWSFETNGRRRADFPGVTFADDGRVTGINLQGNNLEGVLFTVSVPQLSEVTSLNLSQNRLRGDVSRLVATMTKLRSLDLSYNQLAWITEPSAIANTCTSKNLKHQFRQYVEGQATDQPYVTDILSTDPQVILVCKQSVAMSLPSLLTYEYVSTKNLTLPSSPTAYLGSLSQEASTSNQTFIRNEGYRIWKLEQDALGVLNLPLYYYSNGYRHEHVNGGSAYPVQFHYTEGDADLSAYTNVKDVQLTLNYILAPQTVIDFNYSAANTYADQIINVQDIVATVNIILDNRGDQVSSARSNAPVYTDYDGEVYEQGGLLMLNTAKPVSAIDIELVGVSTNEVSLMLNYRDYQMMGRNTEQGSRYVIFSPTGKYITTNSPTALLRMSANGQPVAIECSDPSAQDVNISISSVVTGINDTSRLNSKEIISNEIFDLHGRRVAQPRKGIYVSNGQKMVVR